MKINLDNGFITYDLIGKGVPLLFIHGYPLSRKIWQPQAEALSDIASIITIDLRGHGDSFAFDPPYTMELLAEDCKRLLDHLSINEPIIVCGLSMGGYVAFALYRRYPQILRGMILTSTRAGADSAEGRAGREAAIKNVRERGVAFIADSMLPKLVSPATPSSQPKLMTTIREIILQTSIQGVVGASQGMCDRLDSTPILAQIDFPVLIVHGADDQLIALSEAESIHRSIPKSRLVVIPKAGHLTNMEQPDQYNRAVRDYIVSLA